MILLGQVKILAGRLFSLEYGLYTSDMLKKTWRRTPRFTCQSTPHFGLEGFKLFSNPSYDQFHQEGCAALHPIPS